MKQQYVVNKDTYNSIANSYAEHAYKKQYMEKYVMDFGKTLKKNASILDLGCGPAQDDYLFIESGFKITGVDFSERMIEEAKKRVPDGTFICSDLVELQFETNSFDAIWSVGSLHFIDQSDLEVLMKKTFSWLKPGGKAFISTKSGKGSGFEKQIQVGVGIQNDKYWVYWEKDKLIKLLEEIGFNVTKITETEPERKKDLPNGFTEIFLNIWFEK
ncbi:MAG: class I SAM-dependent methyltransferase [bacterium]